jgi:hypothetical protein
MRRSDQHRMARSAHPVSAHPNAGACRLHVHGRGHLAPGGRPRCGCGPEVLPAPPVTVREHSLPAPALSRRHHIAFIRTHFIFSDRCPDVRPARNGYRPSARCLQSARLPL